MAVWMVRAGRNGERQSFALDNKVAIVGWDSIPDLSQFKTKEELQKTYQQQSPDKKPSQIASWVGQLWAFAHRIQQDDLIVLPLKGQNAVALGEASGPYEFKPGNPSGAKHTRGVKWIVPDFPRGKIDKDILYSFGAAMTVCQIKRNNAEKRIRAMLADKPPAANVVTTHIPESEAEETTDSFAPLDLGEYASTQIREHIGQKFAGHAFAKLIDAVLKAQGYQTEISDPGPDGGVDIIAGRGPMGFDEPRLCVQVKSGDGQQDVKVIRELKGTMKEFNANQGLFVSWGGFRKSVISEARKSFFDMRLWDAQDVVEAVLQHYEQFPEDLKAELPLKRIWTLVLEVEE